MKIVSRKKTNIGSFRKFFILFLVLFSSKKFVSNATRVISPFRAFCPYCQHDNSRISYTNCESGYLKFFGIIPWGWYEKIGCFCGKNLDFVIIV